MAQIGSPSAGWYTDPSGQHRARYWDGASWTEQVRDDLTDPTGTVGAGGGNPAADTVAGVAEAVAAVAANDIIQPGDAFVVDYGADGPWGSTPGGSAPSDPFAPAPPSAYPTSFPAAGGGPSSAPMAAPSATPIASPPMDVSASPLAPVVEMTPMATDQSSGAFAMPAATGPAAAVDVAPAMALVPAPVAAPVEAPVMPGVAEGPAPGWYPDPAARHQARLWDGTRWTERVADNGIEGLDPLPGMSVGTATVDPNVGAWSAELVDTATAVGPDGKPLSAGQISLASLPETVEPETPAEKAPGRPTVKVRAAGAFVLGGGVALLAGSAMSWMDVTGPKVGDEWSATGLDLGDGRITVALAIVLALLGAAIITGRLARFGGTKVAAMGALVAGAAALAVTAVDIADVADRASRLGVTAGAVSNVGTGLWLAFLGALFAVGGGLMAFANRQ